MVQNLTPKQVKKTATNGGFEMKRWGTHAFVRGKIIELNGGYGLHCIWWHYRSKFFLRFL